MNAQTNQVWDDMKYFAYGSNMLTARLKARVSSAEPIGHAILVTYLWESRKAANERRHGNIVRFNKRSTDSSGKCNIEPTNDESEAVHGVLFEIDSADLPRLHLAEGQGYRCEWMIARRNASEHEAITYVAERDSVDNSLRPYTWYKDLVVAGAEEHDLPSSYADKLRVVAANRDPDQKRDRKNRRLLPGERGIDL